MCNPRLMIITGQPGSGKTTLAKKVAGIIHCPVLCRDEFKEGYVNTYGASYTAVSDDANLAVYEAFFETIALLLSKKISLIAEAAFQHKLWTPQLEVLQRIARLRIVVCQITPELAKQRRLQRRLADSAWKRFHGDTDIRLHRQRIIQPDREYQPPDLPVPTLHVTTTEGYAPNLEEIAAFLLSS